MILIEILLFAIFFMLVRIAVSVSKSGKEAKRSVDERLDQRLDKRELKNISERDDVIYHLTPHDDNPLDLRGLEQECLLRSRSATWRKEQEAKGRPKEELTYKNFYE